jgi:hypothetical protein
MLSDKHKLLLYIGDTLIGDFNKFAQNRALSETLKSESESAVADQFTFSISWAKFKQHAKVRLDDNPELLLRVGKTHVVFLVNEVTRFSGFLATKPARSGYGAEQQLDLRFFEHFARLNGDLVCAKNDTRSPHRIFSNVPGHIFTQDLIREFIARAKAAGEDIRWRFGTINALRPKTVEYNDFQTVSKALCDAMNNESGTGKFDIVFRVNPDNHSEQIIDILKPRGQRKNIIIRYPSDGVYKLWATGYSVEESANYASDVLVAGNGQVGNPEAGEDTAELATASNRDAVKDNCYWRIYETQSSLKSQAAVAEYAKKSLSQHSFSSVAPQIKLVGRPIEWGNSANENTGLAIGDEFYFIEDNDDGEDLSGWMRIIGLDTSWDNNGVSTVSPLLRRVE